MRPIKYRAWHRQERKWYEPSHIGVNGYRAVMSIYTGSTWFIEGHYPDDFELLQFTGLVDKNGKDIYEGDIIKADWHWDEPHVFVYPDDFYWINEVSLEGNNLEVIGNLYETPELVAQEVSL